MRVLIATVTAGAGHLQAANALEEAWRAMRPRDNVLKLDVLDFTSAFYRQAYVKGYPKLVEYAPELYGKLFEKSDDPKLYHKFADIRRLGARLPAARFLTRVKKFKPDIVLCSHFLPTEVIGGSADDETDSLNPLIVSVVTDFQAHAMWMEPCVDLYCVAAEETKQRLLEREVPEQKIAITGIPVSQRFSKTIDKAAVMRRYGLRDDLPVLLVLSGGFGMGPIEEIIAALNEVKKPFQAVVVCGRNDELRAKVSLVDRRYPAHLFGFVDNVEEFMSVATLVIGKPGGLTSSETLAMGRPLFMVNPIPGQETANEEFLLRHHAAVKVERVKDLGLEVNKWLGSKKLLKVAESARSIGQPHAAENVCRAVLAANQTRK